MKFKKRLIFFPLLFFFVMMGFSVLNVKGQTGDYEQRISQSNPFIFTVDTIYTMNNYDYRMQNDSFHQAILDGDNYYVFYIKSSLVHYNLTTWIQISDKTESYFREDCGNGEYQLLMIIKPQKTGLYNITLSNRRYDTTDDLFFKIDEIAILEIPESNFYYNTDLDRYELDINENWDSEYVVIGIAHLERFRDYKIQGGWEIYKGYLLQYSIGSEKLDGNNPLEEQYTENEVLNVTVQGDYLFYELLGNPFTIHYQEMPSDTPHLIPGYSILFTVIATSGGILVILKRSNRKSKS
ncbi:MAG: hypothetical protein ACFFDF_04100 [Candidatus Odinarchaeota archaeon]